MKNLFKTATVLVFCVAMILSMSSVVGAVDYVGPEACITCHSTVNGYYIESGHPYKLNKVIDGTPLIYPFSEVPDVPAGYTWGDITYVIGGYGWKARFLDSKGYIITGDAVQYNLATKEWSGYHSDEAPGTKKYTCGTCHTTGWQTTEENGGKTQDDLEGMAGTFASPGITCEACHGPGGDHVGGPNKTNISRDTTKEMCGTCHYRDAGHKVETSGGLIRHHEQFDEMINSPHRTLECITCHEPHKSTKYSMGGLKDSPTCVTCHSSTTVKVAGMVDHSCNSCHMPLSTKSAIKTGEIDFGPDADTGYLGDIHSHTFRLNTDPAVDMFTEDGKYLALDSDSNAIVKVEFACANCHNGEVTTAQTVDWMYANAKAVHTGEPILVADLSVPAEIDLSQNFPNPFNPVTNIRYDLKVAGNVEVNIYDIRGALVSTLVNGQQSPGRYIVTWNGTNNNGLQVASGIYIYRLVTNGQVISKQMNLLR